MIPGRPEPGEHDPCYQKYISKVAGEDVLGALEEQLVQFPALFAGRGERDGDFRYAPGKWTVKESLGHVNDAERVLAYRALRIARNDQTPMEGFEQDDYVRDGPFSGLSLGSLVEEFRHVRRASLALFRGLRASDWLRAGVANNARISVRALAWIIAGHTAHHRELFEERYFPAIPRA